ncbi:MAG: hypothetical protein WCJ35_00385 [Planctomycetota bacterium]
MPFAHLQLRPEAKLINGIDDTVELPNVLKPGCWESDINRFFDLTFPTVALRKAIRTVTERFAQPMGAKGLFFIEKPYGTGKSHFLVTIQHVLSGETAAQQWLQKWPATELPLLPDDLIVYSHSFVEHSPLDLVNDVLLKWLGLPEQRDRMADVQLIDEMITNSPWLAGRRLVLILDELARWFSNLKAQAGGDSLVARAEAFIQAAGNYANRSDKLTLIVTALPGLLPSDVQAVIVRNAVQLEIRASDQLSVVLHRIFENYDPNNTPPSVAATVDAFRQAYGQAGLPTGEVDALCDDLLKSYPIHPDFAKLVLERFPKGSNFQNERGALNYIARVVSLAEDRQSLIVTPAQADVRDEVIRRKLGSVDASGTDLPKLAADDLGTMLNPSPLHDQVMATVVGFSLVSQRDPGATREDILRACVAPGVSTNDVLASLKTIAATEHVWPMQDRYLVRDRRNPANTVATQARRELQRNRKQYQDYLADTSIREVFGGTSLVYSDLAAFGQMLAAVSQTQNPYDVKFVICTRRLTPDERKAFFLARPNANLFVMLEPIDASYDPLNDDTLLFDVARTVAAGRLHSECREASLMVEATAYRKESEVASTQVRERLQGAYGRMLLWKTQPQIYDEIEIDTITLRGKKFTYDLALQELKGFEGDPETHRRDILTNMNRLTGQAIPVVEQVFRETLGLHVPVPKDVVGDTLIQMAKENEISLVHPNHTYCGADDDYGQLTRNQRIELGRCKVADPLPQQSSTVVHPPQGTGGATRSNTSSGGGISSSGSPPWVQGTIGFGTTTTSQQGSAGSSAGTSISGPGVTATPSSIVQPQAAIAVVENIPALPYTQFLAEIRSRVPVGSIVEHAEVSIEIQDTLQPVAAADWVTYAGTVDKPTDLDLAIKLTRHTPTAQPELEQWVASLPNVPNAEYRAFLKVLKPLGTGAQ